MGFYNYPDEKIKEMGADPDLYYCLMYNPQDFTFDEIIRVLAVIEGENEGADWHWVLRLTNNRYVYMWGGCDYTGWDCQSWAENKPLSESYSVLDAVSGLHPPWMTREDTQAIAQELVKQITTTKKITWREQKDVEFGIRSQK